MIRSAGTIALAVSLGVVVAAGCSQQQQPKKLTGAGATFPNPIYSKWFVTYAQKTGVQVNYQSIGSGGGVKQFLAGTVDFGATDGPMTDEQIKEANNNVVHVPTVLGAVVVTYNQPALGQSRLKLDGSTIADIFLGKISKWNDSRIAALNPELTLPDKDILVVHRSDGSGTTFVFSDYLAKVSPEWLEKVGRDKSLKWPVGMGGQGNEGVTNQVKQTEGSIGYVELVYALTNKLPYALVKNAAGQFADATLEGVSAAAAGAKLSDTTDFRVSITDAAGPSSYPISSFTWLLVYADNPDAVKATEIRDFLNWMTSDEAQNMAKELGYGPLPTEVATLVRERVKTLKAKGAPIK